MKQIFFFVLLLFINNCKQSVNEQTKSEIDEHSGIPFYTMKTSNHIDFVDAKYQKNGFVILDNLNGDVFPSYSYFDSSIGAFSVSYIGKTRNAQYFWDVLNPSGYFSNYKNPEDTNAQNSKNIKNSIN